MRRVVFVRHHGVDSAGFIAAAFEAQGAELTVHLWPDDGPLPALDDVDHVVLLGAVSSVNDPDPWIGEELAWLRGADEAGLPVLGICFGAQAICAAFGGRVEAMPRKEIGWTLVNSVDQADPGRSLAGVPRRPLPARRGHSVLARNDVGVQAFQIGGHLAVQFHPEVDGPQLKLWLDAGGTGRRSRRGSTPLSSWPTPSAKSPPRGNRPPGGRRAAHRRGGQPLRNVTSGDSAGHLVPGRHCLTLR